MAEWKVPASSVAKRTSNPIRKVVDQIKVKPNPEKEVISLSIGDPTIFGNLNTPPNVVEAIIENAKGLKGNGYPPSTGYDFAREAVAKFYTHPSAPLTKDDVIIASGCSGAIELAIGVLGDEKKNLLIPRPGFSLYRTICDSKGIEPRYYDLKPDCRWELDLASVESQIDGNTIGLLVNNPSNPCGSNYTKEHLQDILNLAEKHRIPIISDEIYADMTFKGETFVPMATLPSQVPILTVGGLAKRWMVPGWRVGWVLIHDRNDVFAKEVRAGLVSLTQITLGANSLIQTCLSSIFEKTPQSYYDEVLQILEEHATFTCERIGKIPGLRAVVPQGAMYVMVGIEKGMFKDIRDDADFCEKLLGEQSVFCLPGQCFQFPDFFRIVFTPPKDRLEIAYNRLEEFCKAHLKD